MEPLFLYMCAFALFVFVVATILWLIVRRMPRHDLNEGLTDEQVNALGNQRNVIGCAVFVFWGFGAAAYLMSQLFHLTEEQIQPFLSIVMFVLMLGVGIYIGISAIRYQVISGTRGARRHPRGGIAVGQGVALLVFIAVVLYTVWLKIFGH